MLLAIDPGLSTGWALYNINPRLALISDKSLIACGMGQPPDGWPTVHGYMRVEHLIIEKPQVYPGTPAGKANDLITLAFQAGSYVGSIAHKELTVVKPHTWKGDLPKPVHHLRMWKVLSGPEKEVASKHPKLLAHLAACIDYTARRRKRPPEGSECDMMDAIGLGLYALNRLRP